MRNHQTLGRRTIDTCRTQGFSVVPTARRVILLAAIGFLCFGTSTARSAAGAEGSGQSAAASEYEKMRNRTFSEEQWIIILRQRPHQPIAIWQGIGTGTIEATTTGLSFSGLQFEKSKSGVLEHHLSRMGLMAKYPLMFLTLFEEPDPETVLTGAAAYQIAFDQGEFKPDALSKDAADRIAAAIREKLLTHRDVRIRWLAVQLLGETKWMMPDDVAKAMDDPTDAIRITTVFWVPTVKARWSMESDPDNTEQPAPGTTRLTREQFREREALLADILLDHVNDTHFYIREKASDVIHNIFLGRAGDSQAANPARRPIALPRDFDWVRSDWQRRVTTQKIWRQWWRQNGAVVKATP